MDEDIITVVSGLPRSGTSLMMKMLDEGGIVPLMDHVREADADNPKGYYEFERVKGLPDDTAWLPEACGKVVKVLAELIKHLPTSYHYRIVFMMRNIDEIIASQKKMIIRRGEDPDVVSDPEMTELLRRYLKSLKMIINSKSNMDVLYISYNDIMNGPQGPVDELMEFFEGSLDRDAVMNAIDPSLYRNRN